MLTPEELNRLHQRAYRDIAVPFAQTATVDPIVASYLDQMVQDMDLKDIVLDIGCGGGQYTNYLADRVQTIGIDLSPEFLKVAKANYPTRFFRSGDMRHLDFPDRSVSGSAAIASLLHIPKAEAPLVLTEFRRVLKDHGRLVLLMKLPDPNYSGDGLETRVRSGEVVTRYFARYSEDELMAMVESSGYRKAKLEVMHFEDSEPWTISRWEVNNG